MIVVIGLPAYAASADGEGSAGGLAVEVAAAAAARQCCGAGRQGRRRRRGRRGGRGAGPPGSRHAALLRDPPGPTPVLAPWPERMAPTGPTTAVEPSRRRTRSDDRPRPGRAAARRSGGAARARGRRHLPGPALPGRGSASWCSPEPLPEAAVAAVVEGATFAGARLVVLVPPGAQPPTLPADATVLEAPAVDDGSFGRAGRRLRRRARCRDGARPRHSRTRFRRPAGSPSPTEVGPPAAAPAASASPSASCRVPDYGSRFRGTSFRRLADLPPGFDPSAMPAGSGDGHRRRSARPTSSWRPASPSTPWPCTAGRAAHPDRDVAAAGLYGMGNALYRLDREAEALAAWEQVTALRETPVNVSGLASGRGGAGSRQATSRAR